MGFLIRTCFWFSLVLLMLPFGGNDADGTQVGPLRALMAAREAVGDLAAICERKPDVCETGKSALHTIGMRARATAKIAYGVLDDQLGETDKINTGTVATSGKATIKVVTTAKATTRLATSE